MINAIFKGLFKVVNYVIELVLTPVNLLVSHLFPDFSQMIGSFTYAVDTYIGGGLAYFFSLLPGVTRYVVLLYLSVLISYYTISVSLFAITKIWSLIQKIKVW